MWRKVILEQKLALKIKYEIARLGQTLSFLCWAQCDHIGSFLKAFGNKFSDRISRNISQLFEAILKNVFKRKKYCGYFKQH